MRKPPGQTGKSLAASSSKANAVRSAHAANKFPARLVNRLKDEVYREMLLLEVNRPGAEMGLALALLRAVVEAGVPDGQEEFQRWVRMICPVGLQMIETSLGEGAKCQSERCRERT